VEVQAAPSRGSMASDPSGSLIWEAL